MGDVAGVYPLDGELARALDDVARLAWQGVAGCDGASVSLFQDGTPTTLAASHARIGAFDRAQYGRGRGPCVDAMRRHEPVTVEDFRTDLRWPDLAGELAGYGARSSLSLPLDDGGRTVGGLNLYADAPRAFTAGPGSAAAAFARQAALLLRFLQGGHIDRAVHARQLAVAAGLQRSLLPALPPLGGISSAARYLAGGPDAQVGGDWYDLFALPDGAIGVAVGDVMGHDVAAAAAMGQLRSVLRSYAYEGSSPSTVLDRLDRLVQAFDMAQLATAVYGRLIVDQDAALLVFANGGHPPPVVRRPDGAAFRLDRALSLLIGALPPGERVRSEAAVTLPAGALLLLYTDGLVESRGRDIEGGIDLLCATVSAVDPRATPDAVCGAIITSMIGPDRDDDVALLVIRID